MLTDTIIRKTKPAARPLKLSDGGGMHLLLKPDGSRYWRMNYLFDGKQKTLALGYIPSSLLRMLASTARKPAGYWRMGPDLSEVRKTQKATKAKVAAIAVNTFEKIARDWMSWRVARGETAETTANKDRWLLESYLLPHIGSRPITEITPPEESRRYRQMGNS